MARVKIHKLKTMERSILSAFIVCLLGAVCYPAPGGGKFVPPEGRVLVFAGQNKVSIDSYVKTTGIVPAGLMLYTSIQKADSLDRPADFGAGVVYGRYLVDKYPNTALQIGLYMVDALDGVVSGLYDDNIDKIGRFIKNSRRPVYLRIGYEFDGPHNHYEPEKYIKAYRHIADRLRAGGVDNVAYVWHSYASWPKVQLLNWYPGDEYVDWFGISYFGQSENEMKDMLALAAARGKPVMIAESTPMGIGTACGLDSWHRWFEKYFAFIGKNDIKAISYINTNWDALPMFTALRWKDSRLDRSAEVKKRWIKEITGPKYLHSSPELFELLDYRENR